VEPGYDRGLKICAPPMEFRCTPVSLSDWGGDTLAVGLAQDDHGPLQQALEARFGPDLSALLEQRRFKGKAGDVLTFTLLGQAPAQLIVVGLGEAQAGDVAGLRSAAAAIARAAVSL